QFIHDCLVKLNEELDVFDSSLLIKHNTPVKAWKELFKEYNINSVFTNNDYEPYAIDRDNSIEKLANKNNASFNSFKDQVIFEKDDVLKDDGTPYTVFTPYSRKWKSLFQKTMIKPYSTADGHFTKKKFRMPSMKEIGFKEMHLNWPPMAASKSILQNYKAQRDFPGINGTTKLSVHLRFGTISTRKCYEYAIKHSDTWMNELIWREFYKMILWHFPQVVKEEFKSKYADIQWNNNESEFKAWCNGTTGYPMVDAGMRELNATGFMHNRVRMVVASFLTKHLLIDWRWGETYFAEKLLDFDLSANNGGWQWAAGTGSDAAPYFRIFNPESQMKKFDKDLKYIKHWVPEYGTDKYPEPIVDHRFARERCLSTYKAALS
ncbi:MAG: deoxyribodipyrimidine photo-lyase, partial [Bacteroidia bacterium]|nr:deoxyribodipyrimidine photo-lyase [Bacteroidia bacterium]